MISSLSDTSRQALLHAHNQPARGTSLDPHSPAGYQGSSEGLSAGERIQRSERGSEASGDDPGRDGTQSHNSTVAPQGAAGQPQSAAEEAEPEDPRKPKEENPEEQQETRELEQRDREVRAHEQAHASAGGRYAGHPSYDYERGPDGELYAVGGEVSIDAAPVPNDPEATIDKMRVVRRAALAPAQPSPQDRRVAAEAARTEAKARRELHEQRQDDYTGEDDDSRRADRSTLFEDDGFTAADVGQDAKQSTQQRNAGGQEAGSEIASAINRFRSSRAFSGQTAFGRRKLQEAE